MNPNFSDLPFEIQVEYLLNLPYHDILRYCQADRTAHQICEDPRFWNQKSLFEFEIPLEYAPTAPTSAQRYVLLGKEYKEGSEELLLRMIRGGLLAQALRLYDRTSFRYEDAWSVGRILGAAVDSGRADLLSKFLQKVHPGYYPGVLSEIYLQVIRMDRPDLEEIVLKYYSPESDPVLREEFNRFIREGNTQMVRLLRPTVRGDPEYELMAALFSDNLEMIDYFAELYPELMKNRRVMNEMAQVSVTYGKLNALKELLQRAGDLIDLQALRRSTWLNVHPQIREFLRQ